MYHYNKLSLLLTNCAYYPILRHRTFQKYSTIGRKSMAIMAWSILAVTILFVLYLLFDKSYSSLSDVKFFIISSIGFSILLSIGILLCWWVYSFSVIETGIFGALLISAIIGTLYAAAVIFIIMIVVSYAISNH